MTGHAIVVVIAAVCFRVARKRGGGSGGGVCRSLLHTDLAVVGWW